MQAGIVLAHFSYSPPLNTHTPKTLIPTLSLSLSLEEIFLFAFSFFLPKSDGACVRVSVFATNVIMYIYIHTTILHVVLSLSLSLSVSVLAFVLDFSREKRQAAADRFVTHTTHTHRERETSSWSSRYDELSSKKKLSFISHLCVTTIMIVRSMVLTVYV